ESLEILGDQLRAAGWQVMLATNGKDALEKVETYRPRVIVLDMVMPEMDGFQVASQSGCFQSYTQHLDVCMLCYEMNDYTKFIYPLKLHESLGSGRPVVGSPIRSLVEFAQIIRLVRTTDEWSQALHDSLAPPASSVTEVEARRSIARQYDWNRVVELIAHALCAQLGPEYLKRANQISATRP